MHRFDLEHPADINRLAEDPVLALAELRGLVVIDEVQRRLDLSEVVIVHAGQESYRLAAKARAVAARRMEEDLAWLQGDRPAR